MFGSNIYTSMHNSKVYISHSVYLNMNFLIIDLWFYHCNHAMSSVFEWCVCIAIVLQFDLKILGNRNTYFHLISFPNTEMVQIEWMFSCGRQGSTCTVINKRSHGPLARYVKLRVAHAPGMPGTFSPPPWINDPGMHHGTCVTHVPWCMPGSLVSGFLWSRLRGKRSRHSRRMRNPHFTYLARGPCWTFWPMMNLQERVGKSLAISGYEACMTCNLWFICGLVNDYNESHS